MFQYQAPKINLIFGYGALEKLPYEVKKLGKKAMIVTGKNSMKKLGFLDKAINELKKNNIDVTHFGEIEPNPTVIIIDKGARLAFQKNCDVIIGFGGGSSIDVAKAIAIMVAHPEAKSIWEFSPTNKNPKMISSAIPVIAVNSTSGTGSHLTPYYVITNSDTNQKPGNGHNSIFPKVSIVDLDVVSKMPPSLTAESGFDVMAHVMEGLISSNSTPFSNIYALEAIRLVWDYLPIAYNDGKQMEAREKMALADCLAGWVLTTADSELPHALGHPITGFYPKISHGMSLAIIMPSIIRFNIEHGSDRIIKSYCLAAEKMGAKCNFSGKKDALKAADKIEELLKNINLNKKLKEFNVKEENLSQMAKSCMETMFEDFKRAPFQPSIKDIYNIYKENY
jgi:alcohol dehydrogenase class IV